MKATQPTARARKSRANAPRTEGLTALDQDRASSVADEGGTSAATVEAQPPTPASAPAVEGEIDPDATPPFPGPVPSRTRRKS
jgi:hypothetical protein